MGFAALNPSSELRAALRIAEGTWSIAVAAVRGIAGIAARAVSVPIMVADIPHALGWREVARRGEIAHGDRRCRHRHGAAQRGASDDSDRESFHGIPPSVAAPSMDKSRPFPWRMPACDGERGALVH